MKRLFVGQRVKVVRNVGPAWCRDLFDALIGLESRIATIRDFDIAANGHTIELEGVLPPGGALGTMLFHPDDLEPILDGHDPCEADFKASLDRLLEQEALPA